MDRRDRFLGCLLGGAVGDAFGAPIEFLSLDEIHRQFGQDGIRDFAPAYGKLGAITDDTQMTLFTAEGLIRASNHHRETGRCDPVPLVYRAYLRWLATQGVGGAGDGWLAGIPELNQRRGPGNTCVSALESGHSGSIQHPLNMSKGCGGVMRVSPVGLCTREPFELGCETAALTHGHPSGYLSAGFLAAVISGLVDEKPLDQALRDALRELQPQHDSEETWNAVSLALDLAEHHPPAAETIAVIGEGWTGEEALGIAVFCATVARDFEHGVTLAVNHGGDSDSTGAITGNILGTLYGVSAVPSRWLDRLDLRPVIEQVAEDLLGLCEPEAAPVDPSRYPPE